MNKTKLPTLCLALATSLAIPQNGWIKDAIALVPPPPGARWNCPKTVQAMYDASDYVVKIKLEKFLENRKGRYRILEVWKGNDINVGEYLNIGAYDNSHSFISGMIIYSLNHDYVIFMDRCKEHCSISSKYKAAFNAPVCDSMRGNTEDYEPKTKPQKHQ